MAYLRIEKDISCAHNFTQESLRAPPQQHSVCVASAQFCPWKIISNAHLFGLARRLLPPKLDESMKSDSHAPAIRD